MMFKKACFIILLYIGSIPVHKIDLIRYIFVPLKLSKKSWKEKSKAVSNQWRKKDN